MRDALAGSALNSNGRPDQSQLPLSGLRVIEAAGHIAAPFAGMILAELGADVIKVEPPRGDSLRRIGERHQGTSILFLNCNRAKRSIVLDLTDEPDRETLQALLKTADVFTTNWRNRFAKRIGFSDETIARVAASLIRVYLSGYGEEGPMGGRPVYDALIQAATGLAYVQGGGPGGKPELVHSFLADKITGMMMAETILASLWRRSRFGKGHRVDIAMLDALAYFNFPDLLARRTVVDEQRPDVSEFGGTNRPLPTADGWIVVSPVTGFEIERTTVAVGHPEWWEQIKSQSSPAAVAQRLFDLLETVTPERTSTAWDEAFNKHDVASSVVRSIDAHLLDEQVAHNHVYGTIEDSTFGSLRHPWFPALEMNQRTPDRAPRAAPLLDQHGSEIRLELESSHG